MYDFHCSIPLQIAETIRQNEVKSHLGRFGLECLLNLTILPIAKHAGNQSLSFTV